MGIDFEKWKQEEQQGRSGGDEDDDWYFVEDAFHEAIPELTAEQLKLLEELGYNEE